MKSVFGKRDNENTKCMLWSFTDSDVISCLTTEFILELQSKLVNEIEGLHQEDVVFEGRGRHGPQ